MPDIRVSAVAFLDAHNRILSVRKRRTTMFMQPGGKPEPGETPAQTAIRECHEELGLTLDPALLTSLGRHRAAAANESGFTVVADCFTHPLTGTPSPAAEIEEMRWDALDGPLDETCAALMRTKIIPALIQQRGFTIRRYADDAHATREVFWSAIRETASTAYDAQQVAAWANPDRDLEDWDARRRAAWTVVAERDGQVIGFSDLTVDGVLDMLFVDPHSGRKGVGRALVGAVLGEARRRGLPRVDVHASDILQPMLTRMGFETDARRDPNLVRGVNVPNWEMHVTLEERTLG